MASNRVGSSSGSNNIVGAAADQVNCLTDPQDQAKAQFLQQQRAFQALTTVSRRPSRDSFAPAGGIRAGTTNVARPTGAVSNDDDTNLTPGPVNGDGVGCRMGADGGSGNESQGV